MRAFSFGGGVQSMAGLVLSAERRIDFPLFIFANVGNDSENPATLAYLEGHAKPYAQAHGIELVEVQKRLRDGSPDTLVSRIERGSTTVPIPMRMSQTGAPGNRTCTAEFKINVVAKELRGRGATKENPALLALGISLDEYQRMKPSRIAWEVHSWPLVDLRLTRQDCMNVIQSAGLPVPSKSSCFFCPFHRKTEWRRLLRHEPELFAKSVALERMMNERRAALGKDPMWMSDALRPLDEAVTENGQVEMFEGGGCDIAGYCHS